MNVGFIGLGNMGSRITSLLIDGGHNVTVWARRRASLEPFGGRADIVASPAEVGAASEIVGVCVWDERDVDEVLAGERGVFTGMGRGGIVAVHSTISPAACARLRQEAVARGLELVDAPVSVGSALPKLLVMVGGEPEAVERCQPAFSSFGDPVLHLGPIGTGQVAKLVNNTLLAATVGLAADAIEMGGELGLRREALMDVLSSGSSRGTWSALLAAARRPAGGGSSEGRTGEWARKDVGLTAALVAEAHLDAGRAVLRLGAAGAEALD